MTQLVIWTCCNLIMGGPIDLEWKGSDMKDNMGNHGAEGIILRTEAF